jgi:SNF2 family DNA or RNA helicase
VYLVHYEALRLLKDELQGIRWTHIIADECHRIKNRKTQQTQNLKRLETVYKTAMSGTPVVNRPDEMWSVLNWLYPKVYTSYWKFYRRHVEYEVIYPQGFHKIIGPANVEELKAKIAPFYVRRRKDDVLKDLPDKYYTNLYVDLTPQQARAYTEMKKDMLAWIGSMENQPLAAPVVIARLVRLQQFAVAYMEETGTDWDEEEQKATVRYAMSEPSAKLDALMQMLEDNPDEPFVVFSQFKQAINLLKARLKDKDIPACFITGDTHQELRGGIVKRFQEGGPRVLAGTIATGGVGITLTRASRVVFIDRSWSPAYNLQAEDRLHRIGQKNAVQVIDLIARGTVDLGRHQRLDQKWSWIRSILGDT